MRWANLKSADDEPGNPGKCEISRAVMLLVKSRRAEMCGSGGGSRLSSAEGKCVSVQSREAKWQLILVLLRIQMFRRGHHRLSV